MLLQLILSLPLCSPEHPSGETSHSTEPAEPDALSFQPQAGLRDYPVLSTSLADARQCFTWRCWRLRGRSKARRNSAYRMGNTRFLRKCPLKSASWGTINSVTEVPCGQSLVGGLQHLSGVDESSRAILGKVEEDEGKLLWEVASSSFLLYLWEEGKRDQIQLLSAGRWILSSPLTPSPPRTTAASGLLPTALVMVFICCPQTMTKSRQECGLAEQSLPFSSLQ